MKPYSREVSEDEREKSPKPTRKEVGIAALVVGLTIGQGTPLLTCLGIAIKLSPNARLRYALAHAYDKVKGEGESLTVSFKPFEEDLGKYFINFVDFGENCGCLDAVLPIFARCYCFLKSGDLAKCVGRSEGLIKFTGSFELEMQKETPIHPALLLAKEQAGDSLQPVLQDIITKVEAGWSLAESLQAHQDVFDPFYIEMVRGGEMSGTLEQSLGILAAA